MKLNYLHTCSHHNLRQRRELLPLKRSQNKRRHPLFKLLQKKYLSQRRNQNQYLKKMNLLRWKKNLLKKNQLK